MLYLPKPFHRAIMRQAIESGDDFMDVINDVIRDWARARGFLKNGKDCLHSDHTPWNKKSLAYCVTCGARLAWVDTPNLGKGTGRIKAVKP